MSKDWRTWIPRSIRRSVVRSTRPNRPATSVSTGTTAMARRPLVDSLRHRFFYSSRSHLPTQPGYDMPDSGHLPQAQPESDPSEKFSFSATDKTALALRLHIRDSGIVLQLEPDIEAKVARNKEKGKTEMFSADGLCRNLCDMQEFNMGSNEAAAQLWIQPVYSRVAALAKADGQQFKLWPKDFIAASKKTSPSSDGFIDYVAAIVDKEAISDSIQEHCKASSAFACSAVELKRLPSPEHPKRKLAQHIPQTLAEMRASGKERGKTVMRGVLSNGHEWIFLVLRMDRDGGGGVYAKSAPIYLVDDLSTTTTETGNKIFNISPTSSELIAGLMSSWIKNNDKDIGDGSDEWFNVDADWFNMQR